MPQLRGSLARLDSTHAADRRSPASLAAVRNAMGDSLRKTHSTSAPTMGNPRHAHSRAGVAPSPRCARTCSPSRWYKRWRLHRGDVVQTLRQLGIGPWLVLRDTDATT